MLLGYVHEKDSAWTHVFQGNDGSHFHFGGKMGKIGKVKMKLAQKIKQMSTKLYTIHIPLFYFLF